MKRNKLDVSRNLDTPERQAAHIGRAFATGDPDLMRDAVGLVARARGMTEVASATKLNRESLYRSLGDSGNPEFATVIRVMKVLGLGLSVVPEAASSRSRKKKSA